MANRALKIDDSQFELPGMASRSPAGPQPARDGDPLPAFVDPRGNPAAADASVGEAVALPPDPSGSVVATGAAEVADLGPVGALAGEDAMVRAFNQLRAAVRDASGGLSRPEDRLEPAPAPEPPAPGPRDEGPSHEGPAAAAPAAAAGPGAESLSSEHAGTMREDALFTFGAGSGRSFLSGGAGWTDVVRLQGIDTPPDGRAWNLDLRTGTATEVDGAILLSEDASGTISLAGGDELVFSGIERIEW